MNEDEASAASGVGEDEDSTLVAGDDNAVTFASNAQKVYVRSNNSKQQLAVSDVCWPFGGRDLHF